MGYCMHLRESTASFKKKNSKKVLKAIQELHGKETIEDGKVIGTKEDGSNKWPNQHFSWIDDNFYKIRNIKEMFAEWRWGIILDGNNYDITEYLGEKLGDEVVLFNAIAPYMNDGEIIMQGEDGTMWKWRFKDGEFKEIGVRDIMWDDDYHLRQ